MNVPPEGFIALFNGRDLTGWHTVKLTMKGRTFSAEYDGEVLHDNFEYHDWIKTLTHPAFLLYVYDNNFVPIKESLLYAKALTAVGQDVEVHFFADGGHGFGPGRRSDGTSQWLSLLANWIKRQ